MNDLIVKFFVQGETVYYHPGNCFPVNGNFVTLEAFWVSYWGNVRAREVAEDKTWLD